MILYEPERANPRGGIYHQKNYKIGFHEHLHDSYELIYLYEGELEVVVDGRTFILHGGEAILIFPNQIHSARTNGHSRSYLCIFQNSLVGEFHRLRGSNVAEKPVFTVSDTTLIERLEKTGDSRYMIKSCLYEVIALFEQHCGAYVSRGRKTAEHIGQILTFVAEHRSEPITMQDAAREIGYDYHYLSNLLQKGLHTTFRMLLNEYRVSHAKYLLMTTHRTVSDIASECGYDSLCSFNRNFKSISGMTPSEYRSTNVENPRDNGPHPVVLFDCAETR